MDIMLQKESKPVRAQALFAKQMVLRYGNRVLCFPLKHLTMNENKLKVYIGNKKKTKENVGLWQSYFVKPSGKFWKRYFNKKVRQGLPHKRGNWWDWS
jgi:hypothetical protein